MTAPAGPWAPTHRTPPTGASTWTEPSGGVPDGPPLEPGLEVQLVQTRGDWAEVCCSDGWRTWVDGRTLLPLPAPAPPVGVPLTPPGALPPPPTPVTAVAVGGMPTARRRSMIALAAGGLVAVVAVVVGGILVTRGGDDAAPGGNAGPVVRLQAPAGWATSSDGLTVASTGEDLQAAVALGPRVVATVNGAEADLAEAFAGASDTAYTVERDPEEITVDGRRAVAVTLRWTWTQISADGQSDPVDYLVRYVTVDSPTGDSILLEFSAPADQWDAVAPTFEQIPDLG